MSHRPAPPPPNHCIICGYAKVVADVVKHKGTGGAAALDEGLKNKPQWTLLPHEAQGVVPTSFRSLQFEAEIWELSHSHQASSDIVPSALS